MARDYSSDFHSLCLQLCTLKAGSTVFDLAPLIAMCVVVTRDPLHAYIDQC